VIPLPVLFVNDKNCTKIENKGVMKTRPSQQNKTNISLRNNSERSNTTSQLMQVFLRNNIYFIHFSRFLTTFFRWKDSQAATVEGLTFSDPIHKKSARNLNLYNFCHSPKKLAAVSPFSRATQSY
jgi:hypothetical protein